MRARCREGPQLTPVMPIFTSLYASVDSLISIQGNVHILKLSQQMLSTYTAAEPHVRHTDSATLSPVQGLPWCSRCACFPTQITRIPGLMACPAPSRFLDQCILWLFASQHALMRLQLSAPGVLHVQSQPLWLCFKAQLDSSQGELKTLTQWALAKCISCCLSEHVCLCTLSRECTGTTLYVRTAGLRRASAFELPAQVRSPRPCTE